MAARNIVVVLLVVLVAASAARTRKPKPPKGLKGRVAILEKEVDDLQQINEDVVGHAERGFEYTRYIPVRQGCPDGWTLMGVSCVKYLSAKAASFEDSQAACREFEGGDLVVPRNPDEQQTLLSLTSGAIVWIGVVRANPGEPGFVDIKGNPLVWTNWRSGEPSNTGGDENCVVNTFQIGLWNDLPCSDLHNAVCQIPKADIIMDRPIVFQRNFTSPPIISLSVNQMDAYSDTNLNYNVGYVNRRTDGFQLRMFTRGSTHIYQARVDWVAVPDLP